MPRTRIHSVNENIGGIINAKDDTGIPESYLAYGENIIGRPLGAMSSRPTLRIDLSISPTKRVTTAIDFTTPDGIERTGVAEI